MSRKIAREIAMHIIFELGFQNATVDQLLALRFDEQVFSTMREETPAYSKPLEQGQKDYIRAACLGVCEKEEEINKIIGEKSVKWDISRISRVSRAILKLAIYEMHYIDDVPVGAAINEAVELAKEYDSKEASAFINGILGSVAREEA